MRKTSTMLASAAAMLASIDFGRDKGINAIDLNLGAGIKNLSYKPSFKRGKPNPPGTKLARKAAKGRISKATIR